MISLGSSRDISQFSTPNYNDFRHKADPFLAGLDPQQVIRSITPDDVFHASRHPSGFLTLHILDINEIKNAQLRVHLWPGETGPVDADTHYHPWHLASKVLLGKYIELQPKVTTATACEDSSNYEYRISHEPGNKNNLIVDELGLAHVSPAIEVTHSEGDTHFLPAGTYHSAYTESYAITLALMGRTLYDNSQFIRNRAAALSARDQSRRLTADQASEAFRMLKQAVSK